MMPLFSREVTSKSKIVQIIGIGAHLGEKRPFGSRYKKSTMITLPTTRQLTQTKPSRGNCYQSGSLATIVIGNVIKARETSQPKPIWTLSPQNQTAQQPIAPAAK